MHIASLGLYFFIVLFNPSKASFSEPSISIFINEKGSSNESPLIQLTSISPSSPTLELLFFEDLFVDKNFIIPS